MAAQPGTWRREFGNFYVEPDGSFVEREFQIAKHDGDRIWQLVIKRARTPRRAKALGAERRLTEERLCDWNDRRVDVMLALVDRKIEDWPFIADMLVATGSKNIVEFNRHHDNFWGDCTCARCYKIGQNWLGETLMLVRRRLVEGKSYPFVHTEEDMHLIAASQPPHRRASRP